MLLHCFAGCSHTAIVTALGLSVRDLFAGEPLSLAEQEAYRRVREVRERTARERRMAHGVACDRARKWEAIVEILGAKLMRSPDNDALSSAFERALVGARKAEEEANKLGVFEV